MLCDGCGDVVYGKQRGQFINRNFIEIAGRVTLQHWNDRERRHNYQHLTRPIINNQNTEKQWVGETLVFCNKGGVPCFQKYLDRRNEEIKFHLNQRRTENLREIRKQEIEAEEEHERIYGHR